MASDAVDELLSLYGEAAPPDADQVDEVAPAGAPLSLMTPAQPPRALAAAATDTDARGRARALAVSEVVTTEHTYVAGLDTLRAVFYDPLRLLPPFLLLNRPTRNDVEKSMQRVLSPDELHAVFANVESLLEFHRHLLRRLEARLAGWNSTTKIGDIFLEEAAGLSIYVPYLVNYKNALTTLAACQRTNADLRLFLDKAHTNPALRGLNIIGLLILPVQRIPRYRMLLQAALAATDATHPDYADLSAAVTRVLVVADQVNESIRAAESIQRTVEVQNLLGASFVGSLVHPSRFLVHVGDLYKISRHAIQRRTCFLFNDILVYGRQTSALAFRRDWDGAASIVAPAAPGAEAPRTMARVEYKGKVDLATAWVNDLPNSAAVQHAFQIVAQDKTFTFFATDAKTKREWVGMITKAIDDMVKETPELTLLRGEVRIAPVTGLYNFFTIPIGEVMTAAPDGDHAGVVGGTGGDGAEPQGGSSGSGSGEGRTPLSSSAVALRKLGGGLRSGLSNSVPNVAEVASATASDGGGMDGVALASARRREGSSGSVGGVSSDSVEAAPSRAGAGSRTPPAGTGTVSVGRRLLEMMSLGPKAPSPAPAAASVEISGPILLHTSNKESVTPLALRARGGSTSGAAGAAEISGPHRYPGDPGRAAPSPERPELAPPVPLVPLKDLIRRLQAENGTPLQATRRTAVLAPAPAPVAAAVPAPGPTRTGPLAPRLATLQKELQRQSSLIQRAPLLSSRYVYATRDIVTGREGELQVRRGDLIRIVHDSSDVWLTGQVEDRVGWVPKAATSDAPPPEADHAAVDLVAAAATTHHAATAAPRVLIGEALWANDVHQPQQLRFEPGDIIRIGLHNHEGTGWSSGQRLLDGTLGWFPSNLVIIREEESEADEDEPAS